jgi:hypothetical protein
LAEYPALNSKDSKNDLGFINWDCKPGPVRNLVLGTISKFSLS